MLPLLDARGTATDFKEADWLLTLHVCCVSDV